MQVVQLDALNGKSHQALVALTQQSLRPRILRLLPRGTHEYAKFITPSELAAHCRAAGLAMADITGMTYNPFTRRYRLEADASVNYILHTRRPA